jgi:alpha-beta hydrolase superfamily lysophospholipase
MPDLAGTIWGLAEMMARGYVVVATDHPGLGTPGMHPYLIGVSEGRAVLDSVRAARDLPDAGASNRFVVWGHSQGGHASLYACCQLRAGREVAWGRGRGTCHLSESCSMPTNRAPPERS